MVLAMIEGLILQWFFDRKAFDLDAAYGMCVDFVDVYLVAGGIRRRRAAASQRRRRARRRRQPADAD